MRKLVCGLCLAACAVSAEELPLETSESGGASFGDARLRVTFDPATSLPSAITVDGNALIVPNGLPWVKINLRGSTAGLPQPTPLKGLGLERVAPDTVCSRLTAGSWRIDGYLQIVPEQRAVRRWFAFEWTGTNAVKFSGFEMQMGKFPCAEGKGFYILPWRFRDNRFPRSQWKAGVRKYAIHGSESPVVAENGSGWSVLACMDCLQPYSDRAQHNVDEKADGIALSAYASMCGVAHPGKPQRVGDFWLMFRRGGAEDTLRNMHAWHRLVGHLPPKDRPSWVQDLVLYSTHPRGRGMVEPGGFPHAQEYIPYIEALGANAIWLRPVEHASCYVPDELYRLQDDVGSEADHLAYVRAAHARGIKVWRDAVMHGGKSDNRRSQEHPEWVCWKEDGTQQDSYWAYDFNWPSWVKYFADYVEWSTRKYELDGWRMDVPTGSRFPNWNPDIPYDRASYAQHQGGLAQMRAVRAAMKRANPDSCTLAEANPSFCSVTCDAIYDQLLCHAYFHWFNDHPVADVVGWLSRWLEDQRNAFVPGTVWMRYPESHDAYPCDNVWGRAAANALMAFSAWIEGFPLVMNESEDGAFESYRRIFAIRRALPELARGDADYLSVKAPPGVFACRRSLAETESIVYMNFNGHRVTEGGLDLPPFGYTVVRTRGPSVAACLQGVEKQPFATKCGNGRTGFTAELRDMTNGLVRAAYRIEEVPVEGGIRYRVADFGGCNPERVRLVVRMPDVGRWYAHAAEGSFDSPFLVRHPKMDAYRRYDRWMDGAIRWDSCLHPFGFTRGHAAVGGVAGNDAYECFGFEPDADVKLWDRLGAEPGLAVSVSSTNAAAFAVTCAVRPAADALAPRDAGTGDPRLRPAMGGWQYEDGRLRLRIRRTGGIAGMWQKGADGNWNEVLRSFGARIRKPDAPKTPRQVWGGRDPDAKEQAFSPSPYARFLREKDGTLKLFFDGGEVRGIEQNARGVTKPIRTETTYTLDRADGSVGFELLFSCDGRYGKDDCTVEMRAELPDGIDPDAVFADPVFTGWKPWKTVREKNVLRYVYHDPQGPVFAPPRNWRNGISCRLGGRLLPTKIIFDTDMIGDYDDVGAMAVLHALADRGECEILATVSSTHSNASAGTVELLNAWYGRPDIPVGAVKGEGVGGGSEKHRSHIKYERLLAKYPKLWRHRNANDAPDATDVYRRVLAAQPDGSVTICTVGFLTNLRRLLQSKPDRHSPLDGRALVKRKVKVWYAMGWKIPKGRECNIMNDPASARYVLENWPTPIVIDDFNYSQYIYAGRKVAALPDDGNPVRDIFAWCMPPVEKCPAAAEIIPTGKFKDNVKEGHNCFDQSCVLAAVRGPGSFFDVERGRMEMLGDKGDNVWTPDPNGPHARMVDKWPRMRVAALIDDLMVKQCADSANK